MQIRKAAPAEASSICELISSAANDSILRGVMQWPKDFCPPAERLDELIKKGEVFVAVEGKTVLGTITLNHCFSEEYSVPKWRIKDSNPLAVHWLAVRPLHQRKGIGAKLMLFAEKRAKKEKSKSIRLATYHKNTPGNAFYKALGYTKAGQLRFTDWPITDEYNCYEKRV